MSTKITFLCIIKPINLVEMSGVVVALKNSVNTFSEKGNIHFQWRNQRTDE